MFGRRKERFLRREMRSGEIGRSEGRCKVEGQERKLEGREGKRREDAR